MKGGYNRMRRTHSFEIVGIGEFDEFPAKVKEQEYQSVNKNGEPIVKKILTQGNNSEYGWMDANGKVYRKEEVFYNVNGKFVQKVNRTDKVPAYKIVNITDAVELLESDTSFLLPRNETTLKQFNEICPEGKALKFVYKKSSVGFKWVNAFVFQISGELCMLTGLGKRTDALEQFKLSRKKAKETMPEVVEVSADEVAPNLD
jgi:hypothetical protein